MFREPFPKRNIPRLRQLEDFSRHHALRDERRLFPERELRRVPPFHEAREHRLEQWPGRSETFREAVLDETGNGVVKTVRQRQRRAAFAVRRAFSRANVLEEIHRRPRRRSFRVGSGDKLPAMIVRTARENFLPRLGVSGLEIVAVRQLFDFLRR